MPARHPQASNIVELAPYTARVKELLRGLPSLKNAPSVAGLLRKTRSRGRLTRAAVASGAGLGAWRTRSILGGRGRLAAC